jgi:hypothetical protein
MCTAFAQYAEHRKPQRFNGAGPRGISCYIPVYVGAAYGQPDAVGRPTQAREDAAESPAGVRWPRFWRSSIRTRRRGDWVERDRALILTALLAGLRADELLRANVGDLRRATSLQPVPKPALPQPRTSCTPIGKRSLIEQAPALVARSPPPTRGWAHSSDCFDTGSRESGADSTQIRRNRIWRDTGRLRLRSRPTRFAFSGVLAWCFTSAGGASRSNASPRR